MNMRKNSFARRQCSTGTGCLQRLQILFGGYFFTTWLKKALLDRSCLSKIPAPVQRLDQATLKAHFQPTLPLLQVTKTKPTRKQLHTTICKALYLTRNNKHQWNKSDGFKYFQNKNSYCTYRVNTTSPLFPDFKSRLYSQKLIINNVIYKY